MGIENEKGIAAETTKFDMPVSEAEIKAEHIREPDKLKKKVSGVAEISNDQQLRDIERVKKEIENINIDKSEDDDHSLEEKSNEKRFKFYYARKSTKHAKALNEKERNDMEREVLDYRVITPEFRKEDLKTPEFEKKIDIVRERIIDFGKKIGVCLDDRLISNEDIYLLMEDKYKKLARLDGGAEQTLNEILLMKKPGDADDEWIEECLIHSVQHELLHSACKNRIILKKDNRFLSGILYKKMNFKNVSSGYRGLHGAFKGFEEFLTEITNVQIDLENNSDNQNVSYLEGVVFVSELMKDMAERKGKSYAEILSGFQIGMFEGDRKKLKIIKDLYGAEALDKLIHMKDDKMSIMETAEAFGLSNVPKKIKDMESGEEFAVNIGSRLITYKIRAK